VKNVVYTKKIEQSQLRDGDFLLSRSNTPNKVGRSALFRGEVLNCSYPDLMMKFRVEETTANREFIEIALQSTEKRRYFTNSAAGSSSTMVKITKGIVEQTPLILPPLPEQQKIAKILSTWGKAISTTEALIDNSKQQKKALMQQLLTGKKRFAGFEGEWEEVMLGSLGSVHSGGTPSTTKAEYWHGDIDWITPTDITRLNSRVINSCARKISKEGLKNSSAKLLPQGSLLVCTRATIGEMAITAHEMCTNQGFKNIIPKKDSDIEFIYYLLSYEKHKLISKASGSTFLELSKSTFENIKFKVPTFIEQQKIASVLTNADKGIGLLEKQLTDLKQEKKALMQQLLTGKRRVKVDEVEAA